MEIRIIFMKTASGEALKIFSEGLWDYKLNSISN
jgi:hypothetical protein